MRQQAGGLEPEALPAHRIYLRHFADGVAASLADSLLAAFNSDTLLQTAMHSAFNVSAHSCAHREGKIDPKLGGTFLRNHVLYHWDKRYRGTRAWTAALHIARCSRCAD